MSIQHNYTQHLSTIAQLIHKWEQKVVNARSHSELALAKRTLASHKKELEPFKDILGIS
jgi:hypothetical protein